MSTIDQVGQAGYDNMENYTIHHQDGQKNSYKIISQALQHLKANESKMGFSLLQSVLGSPAHQSQ